MCQVFTPFRISVTQHKTAQFPLHISHVGPNQGWTAHSRWEDHMALRSAVRSLSLRWCMAKWSHHFFGWSGHGAGLHQGHTGQDRFAAKQPRLQRKRVNNNTLPNTSSISTNQQSAISNDLHLRQYCE